MGNNRPEPVRPMTEEVKKERSKLKWFLGFVIVVLVLTAVTDIVFSFYASPYIPNKRNPFVTTKGGNPNPTEILIPTKSATNTPVMKACPMDAKQCPDGKTFVGRTGPNCDFVACPK